MTHPNITTRAPRTSSRSTSLSWAAASSLVSRIQFQGDHSWCLSQRDRTRSKMSSHALSMLWRLQIFSTRYRRSCSCRRDREVLGTCKRKLLHCRSCSYADFQRDLISQIQIWAVRNFKKSVYFTICIQYWYIKMLVDLTFYLILILYDPSCIFLRKISNQMFDTNGRLYTCTN